MFARPLRKAGLIRRITVILGCCALVAILFLIVSSGSLAQEPADPLVTITGGQVQGRLLPIPGGAVFKGIPYAAPPVGDLRWREPQPVKPWSGVRQAAEYGDDCPIANGGGGGNGLFFGSVPADHAKFSEDCLFLNIWTPEWPAGDKKPVMIWFHDGELMGGSGDLRSGPAPGAESSLARHGVVLVSVNYRPNLLGMMGHPELTAESPHHSSGNEVMQDAIASVQWVHNNIARFGGDPGNVTIFGQSGGGHVTSFLVTSPLTKGLIHRAIAESDEPAQYRRTILTQQQLEQIGVVTAKVLNAPSTGTIKYLRGLPASQIAAATAEVRRRLVANYQPDDEGIDGWAIPESPPEVYRSHKEQPVPMIIGATAVDSTGVPGAATPMNPEQAAAWEKHVLERFYGKYPDLLERAMKVYGFRGTPNEVLTDPAYGTPVQQMGVDMNHRCAVQTSGVWHSAIAPTWTYEFKRSIPVPAVHTSELRFIFGFLTKEELSDQSALKLQDAMQQYWTNFARNGDPNGPGLPVWSKYNATTKQSMEFANDGPVPRTERRAAICALFTERLNRDPKPLLFDSERVWALEFVKP